MKHKNFDTLDPLKDVEEVAKIVDSSVQKNIRKVYKRYPITFTLLSLFGFAAVLNGLDGLIEKNLFLSQRPGIVLIIGLIVLLFTGTLYKWLTNKEINL